MTEKQPPSSQEEEQEKSFLTILREYGETLIVAVLLALFIREFFVQAFKIPSGSMKQTLLVGDHILVNKLKYGVKIPFTDHYLFRLQDPQRGDIVVFKYPKEPDRDFIKRVVAIPGDVVEVRHKVLYVNGEPQAAPYAQYTDPNEKSPLSGHRDFFGPITLRPDQYFVMGDNRDNSSDSRMWGELDRKMIRGAAFMIYFSWDSSLRRNWGFLRSVPGLNFLCRDGGVRWDRWGQIIE
jgi:signal peptidase I